jgi:hypothetical protein
MQYLSDGDRRTRLPQAVGTTYASSFTSLLQRGVDVQSEHQSLLSEMKQGTDGWLRGHGYSTPMHRVFEELIRMYPNGPGPA